MRRARQQRQVHFLGCIGGRTGTARAGSGAAGHARASDTGNAPQYQQRHDLVPRRGVRQRIAQLRDAAGRPGAHAAPRLPPLRQLRKQPRRAGRQRGRDRRRRTVDTRVPGTGGRARARAPGQQAPFAIEDGNLRAHEVAVSAVVQSFDQLQGHRVEHNAVPARQRGGARRSRRRTPGRQVARRQGDQAVAAEAQQTMVLQLVEQRLVFQRRRRRRRHQVASGRQPRCLRDGAISHHLHAARGCSARAQQLHL
jgi:hypothetical protein